jgi:hypothetical protein
MVTANAARPAPSAQGIARPAQQGRMNMQESCISMQMVSA